MTPPELTELEKKVVAALQRDLPVCARPFLDLARELGLEEETLVAEIRKLMARGVIRRFGATIRHRISGFAANAMVAWQVPESEVERIGTLFARRREVTHCYERATTPEWPYNLYTMIHGRCQEECEAIAREMATAGGLSRYELLFSDAELKKTTMRYFRESGEDNDA